MRHVKFTGPKGEDIEAKLVYDYRWFFLLNLRQSAHSQFYYSWPCVGLTVKMIPHILYTNGSKYVNDNTFILSDKAGESEV